ncbi:MAG: asparagine synthase-related protein [Thermodesulfobacteriota bacterium]|nr:asparagine synthase-related protein [Thermodesulfobacteriota bacterium]
MAGIAGILSLNRNSINGCSEQIEGMLKLMSHRGSDNTVIRSLMDGRGALGANEINLTPDKTYCTAVNKPPYILFDGELYNERPQGQSDVECFKQFYKKYGKDCFSNLEGSFSCAVLDDDEIILARDHVGARPLFYGLKNGAFYFSSEMKGLKDYIRFDIQELVPGYTYSTKEGIKKFDPFVPDLPEVTNLEETAGMLRELVIEAVRKRIKGAGGISLSGGLDSSIVATIAKEFNSDLLLFTVSIEKNPGPDLENAKLMAEFLGMKHHIYHISDRDISDFIRDAVWYLESFDEDCISGIISNYFVSKMAKEYTNSILVGEGADELFGGYRMVLKNPKVTSDEYREQLAQRLLDISYNTALRRLDRGWMANGVDYQTPYLDAKVVAFSQKIPMNWKIYGAKQVEKFILREAFRDMIPFKIANREKLRFAMGVGTDNIMDDLISKKIDPEEIKERPKTAYGLPFASFKEVYYYDEFLRLFPPAYEKQTVRWDPFK